MRLSSVLGAEPEENDPTVSEGGVYESRLAVDLFIAKDPSTHQRVEFGVVRDGRSISGHVENRTL